MRLREEQGDVIVHADHGVERMQETASTMTAMGMMAQMG